MKPVKELFHPPESVGYLSDKADEKSGLPARLSPVAPPDSALLSLLRSRLLCLRPRQLLLLDPGGVRRRRAGQGFAQGRGGPGRHVGHRRLRLQRL